MRSLATITVAACYLVLRSCVNVPVHVCALFVFRRCQVGLKMP